jgi:lysine 2,3-aminomutase
VSPSSRPGQSSSLDYQRFPRWRDVSPSQWNDWQWQASNTITTLDDLDGVVHLSREEKRALLPTVSKYHLALPPYYASLIDGEDRDDPIRRQAIPLPEESFFHGHEMDDPLAEDEASPVPGLTHRYPDRVLLVTTSYCSMYCRHCTRKRIWKQGEAPATRESIERMIDYVGRHDGIRDALVSGGDPLTLPLDRLEFILSRLRAIKHLEIIRIGSRLPVVMPMRITDELVQMLDKYGPVWLNTQFNHPREVTAQAAAAVDRFLRAGIPVNNQTVLLKGINEQPATMIALNQALLRAKIRPYYLFQCDLVVGAEHFRTSIESGLAIMEGLRGHTSGLAIPSYVIDLPGGGGKVPISPNYIIGRSEEGLILRNYEGRTFTYPDPPAASDQAALEPAEFVSSPA